jgi:DNA adenine methylase
VNSFIGWIGGKRLLRKAICDRFPEGFDRYIEVFGGAGWVLFNAQRHAETEVYNDINSDLVNLFRCMKYHPDEIEKEMALLLNARETFECFKTQSTDGMTDIQKAARYLYLIKTSYGCKMGTFGMRSKKVNRIDHLSEITDRLSSVVIENKSFDMLIKQYDRENALFYCDPPYYGTEDFYDTGDFVFDESQHRKLRDLLRGIKGKVILSYNACEFVRDLYRDFNIEEIERQNSLATKYKTEQKYKELIIRNY